MRKESRGEDLERYQTLSIILLCLFARGQVEITDMWMLICSKPPRIFKSPHFWEQSPTPGGAMWASSRVRSDGLFGGRVPSEVLLGEVVPAK